MDWATLPVVQLGAVGVLLAVGWLVFTGRLVPKSTVDEIRAVLDKRNEEKSTEASEWKAAWTAAEETKREFAEQIGDLLELGRTSEQLLRSIQGERADVGSPQTQP